MSMRNFHTNRMCSFRSNDTTSGASGAAGTMKSEPSLSRGSYSGQHFFRLLGRLPGRAGNPRHSRQTRTTCDRDHAGSLSMSP